MYENSLFLHLLGYDEIYLNKITSVLVNRTKQKHYRVYWMDSHLIYMFFILNKIKQQQLYYQIIIDDLCASIICYYMIFLYNEKSISNLIRL